MRTQTLRLLAVLMLSAPALAGAGTYSITPNADPGSLHAGDSLMFTIAVDFVRPPNGYTWSQLRVGSVRLQNTTNADAFNFGGCIDASGVGSIVPVACESADGMMWTYGNSDSRSFSGGLLTIKARFDAAGTYELSIEGVLEEFFESVYGTFIVNNPTPPATIVLNVSEPVPVDERTWGRLKAYFRDP